VPIALAACISYALEPVIAWRDAPGALYSSSAVVTSMARWIDR